MAVVVVRFARPRADGAARAEASGPAASSSAVTWASLLAVAAGVGLVLASIAGGPVWLRVAFIALGALLGVAGLAELAAQALAETLASPAPTAHRQVARRPERPPA